jgi:hypothetical protein
MMHVLVSEQIWLPDGQQPADGIPQLHQMFKTEHASAFVHQLRLVTQTMHPHSAK